MPSMDAATNSQFSYVLRWWLTRRREELGCDWSELARITGTASLKVQAWAEGRSLPNRRQLLDLAHLLANPDHPPGAAPDVDASVEPYSFVIAENGLGVGKCIGVGMEEAVVEYFDTVASRTTRKLPLDALTRVRLSSQTRCYVHDPVTDRWQMGRVKRLRDGDRMIELPDQEVDRVENQRLYVRWTRPVEDPTETLKQKSQETVFFQNRRAPFVQTLVEQRAASRGASGLLSSSIDLYPHQVEVVRRVLEDPIQRYLLADEVGLGKTIEAGVILRQYLIDQSEGSVLVFAPAVLCEQWRQELDEKFDLWTLQGSVTVHPLEEIDACTTEPAPGFIVIDEAHKVVGDAFEDEERFQSLAQWIHSSDRLLLLSATPAHRHEKEFLAMLHLLDPALYDLDDLEAFRLRVQKRSEVGGLLRDFVEGEDAFVLDIALDDLRDAFPDDEHLLHWAESLETALGSSPIDEEARDLAIRTIRLHIKERYRLHHRMLRSRRTDVDNEIDTERRTPSFPEYGMDPREEEVHELLDQWRLSALQTSEADESLERTYVRLFRILMEVAMSDLRLLREVVQYRRQSGGATSLQSDISDKEREALRTTHLYDGEESLLSDLIKATRPPDSDDAFVITKQEWVEQFLHRKVDKEERPTFVVFTTYPSVAGRLSERLQDSLGTATVALHSEDDDPAMAQAAVQRFQTEDRCQVLVCDRSAEEGLNLQFVDHLIHYDLTFSPNRVEQRTGRLDRIGRQGRPMHTHVYVGPEIDSGSMYDTWYTVLADGFDVFDTSIASLQFLVEEIQDDLVRQRFRSGAEHVDDHVALIREQIQEEHDQINRQYEFEALWAEQEGVRGLYDDLKEMEAKSGEHASNLHGWINEALQFHVHKYPYPDRMLQYRPDFNGRTLIPLDTVLNRFIPRSDKPATYDRDHAVNSVAEAGHAASLMRIGHPFLDGLRDYFEWDDRGRAYAIWRHQQNWNAVGGDDQLFFRFEFVVEAKIECNDSSHPGHQAALQRRADAFFPPRFETVITDRDGDVIKNQGLVDLVAAGPYRVQDGGQDMNVKGDRVHLLDRFIDPLDWPNHCDRARDAAIEAVRQKADLIRQREEAEDRAKEDAEQRVERLHLRAEAEMVNEDRSEVFRQRVKEEREAIAELKRGIREPTLRIDSVGVIILSGSACPVVNE